MNIFIINLQFIEQQKNGFKYLVLMHDKRFGSLNMGVFLRLV